MLVLTVHVRCASRIVFIPVEYHIEDFDSRADTSVAENLIRSTFSTPLICLLYVSRIMSCPVFAARLNLGHRRSMVTRSISYLFNHSPHGLVPCALQMLHSGFGGYDLRRIVYGLRLKPPP